MADLPDWLNTDEARDLREEFPEDRHRCEECNLPFWACQAVFEETRRRGGGLHHFLLKEEARAALRRQI